MVKDVGLFDGSKQDMTDTIVRVDNEIRKVGVFGRFRGGKRRLMKGVVGDKYLVSCGNGRRGGRREL
ncbi:hypothetical protein [Staphylococcus epidermidis]|uniref:hypothetical protein n=1 Tax=Staphylococcus epidermidis TaxID=1282 RepID=UPI0011A935A1|nr:hypothetical protein [Staphylococcus epidermidis]